MSDQTPPVQPQSKQGEMACEFEINDYWSPTCTARARFRIERPGEGYSPGCYCSVHVGEAMADLADGDDVPITVGILWDEGEGRA